MTEALNRFSVEGKKILLTGAAGGLGMALLRGFLEAGAIVFATTRRPETDWQGLESEHGPRLRPLCCDLADQSQVVELADRVGRELGEGDVLINNASICPHADRDHYSPELMRQTMAVTFEAPYILCGRLAPVLARAGGGAIINITSINAEQAWPGNPAYMTAKSALRHLTRALARDYGPAGLRANNLCPGYLPTRMTETSFNTPDLHEERRGRTLLGRWGRLEDLVGPAIFLASAASAYITGADLHVDGGWLSKGL